MSRETIIRSIVQRETQSLGLTAAAVRQDAPELYRTACKLFGAWSTALQYAGVNLRRVSIQQAFTRERVIHRIQVLIRTGYSLTAGDNRQRDYHLYKAALRYFGSWRQALLATGINPQLAISSTTKRPRLKTAQIFDQLRQWKATGHSLLWADICLENHVFAKTAKRRFGSWTRALVVAGVLPEPTQTTKNQKWSRERIVKAIQARREEGKPMNYMAVRIDESKLTEAARRYFGNWDNALTAAGVSPQRGNRPLAGGTETPCQ